LHSNPKYGTTNEDGEVFFEGVEKGTHTLKIAYQNYTTEQKLQVEGDAQAFDVSVNVTLTETGVPYNWAFAAVVLTVITVGFLLLLVRRKSQEDER
jgi:ACR3 family arsenite efflux pump ArsB